MKRIKVKSVFSDIKNSLMVPIKRKKMIAGASNVPLQEYYPANILAGLLHPQNFWLNVSSRRMEENYIIIELISPNNKTEFWFKAGQSLAVKLKKNGAESSHALSVISLPGEKSIIAYVSKEQDEEAYDILRDENCTSFLGVSFEGVFTYSRLRDGKSICLIADVDGVASSLSIALFVAKEYNDVRVELNYFDPSGRFHVSDFVKNKSNINVVLACDMPEKITVDSDTLFVCGSDDFCEKIRGRLNGNTKIRERRLGSIREVAGENHHVCQVICKGRTYEIKCREGEKLLRAIERANIPVNARCAEGDCGYCRSKLIDGEVKSLMKKEHRTSADICYGYIHPCSVTAVSDLTIEI